MAELCAPGVASGTLSSIASVESSFNPFAIGVVGARLQRQPRTLPEALATARALETQGYDYSVGFIQVNQKNFAKYGLTPESAFDPCTNLRVGSLILQDCYKRAGEGVGRWGDALSCYYSGDFTTGYRLGYVAKVKAAGGAAGPIAAIPVTPREKPAKRRMATKPHPASSEPLFVTASASPPTPSPGAGDASSAVTPKPTALLF